MDSPKEIEHWCNPDRGHELTDEACERTEPHLLRKKIGGRWNDHRITLNGIIWIPGCGALWRDMLERYGTWQSVCDHYRRWARDGLFDRILHRLHLELDDDGRIDWSVFNVDGSNIRADRSAAGAGREGAKRTTRPCPGTNPRRLWLQASCGDPLPQHGQTGNDPTLPPPAQSVRQNLVPIRRHVGRETPVDHAEARL